VPIDVLPQEKRWLSAVAGDALAMPTSEAEQQTMALTAYARVRESIELAEATRTRRDWRLSLLLLIPIATILVAVYAVRAERLLDAGR